MMMAINGVMLAVGSSLAGLIVVKVTVVAALGLVAARLARRGRAAVRHALLTVTFGATLVLPIVSIVAPPFHITVPVGEVSRAAGPLVVNATAPMPPVTAAADGAHVALAASQQSSTFSLSVLLLAGWIVGTAVFLLPVMTGLWQIRSMRRSGLPWVDGQSVAETLALDAGIHRHVEVLLHEALPGPITCGVFGPAIVLPRDAESWAREDLIRAIIHELEHVRRGDSATRCLARSVCALYWFHPFTWIAWSKLVLEAERSCDDAVLRRSEATAYADQLVSLAKRLPTVEKWLLLAMANRSDLSARVGALLDDRQRRGRVGVFPVTMVCAVALMLITVISPLVVIAAPQAKPALAGPIAFGVLNVQKVQAQSRAQPDAQSFRPKAQPLAAQVIAPKDATPQGTPQAARPTAAPLQFEVTSVKPLSPKPLGFQGVTPACKGGHFAAITPVFITIEWAYDLQTAEQAAELREKLPQWAQSISGSYELEATTRPNVTEQECRVMTQKLFEDRFHFKYHWDTVTGRVYEMVVARGGFKMRPADPNDPASNLSITVNGVPAQPPPADFPVWQGTTMDDMASRLSGNPDRIPVINKTGIQGKYKLKLTYSYGPGLNSAFADPDMITAVEQQLGLKLQEARGPVAHFVVDSIEKPDAN
jgi:uncharacterized protein (TIGR03435 family)